MPSINTPEAPLKSATAPPPESKSSMGLVVDVALRVLLLATGLVAIIVMVTSKQTKMIPVAQGLAVPLDAKFNQSPAFIYFVAALSVACLYSVITFVLSVLALMRGGISTKMQFHFVMFDALLLGIVAAATGAAGGVAYIGLKGNSHT
ncbi:hypothetical protein L1987_73864 [Smallanthus sonchifolius]|uniref:Uncharacterized protein n=1 Tax=Smallanthus sonchifolius TaxID=185202 RepID=A0ACB9A0F6_9ASTR|nr:hypothetical protein L1987_73864 [Smallanthus sonchifolius]